MALLRRRKDPRDTGRSPFFVGALAIVITLILVFEGFTQFNPFHHPFTLKATFMSANSLQPKSPVRIAGVTVGLVKDVEPLGNGKGAVVTMAIEKSGLPIHKDAELKIRPRIFLEGNFFVDINPGTPTSKTLASGSTIPVQQTSTPVQFGQVLTSLQANTREDLRTLFAEYALKGLGNGGAEAYNNSLNYAPSAFKYASLANEGTLGRQQHDLSHLVRGQQRLFAALSANPAVLKDLITQLNTTFGAFAREDTALQATVPALRDTLRVGTPALASVDQVLPPLRAFARDALPGVRSSGPTIDASMPFIRQLRLLVRPQELRGLVADLRPTIPALARLNRATVPLLNENRTLSACQNKVLLPFAKDPIPDPDFPANSGQPFYKQASRGLVGLAGESRLTDANTPFFHVQVNTGAQSITNIGDRGEGIFATASAAPSGVRPARPNRRPDFRPGTPCETQQTPDLNAPGGKGDVAVGPLPGAIGGLNPTLPSLPVTLKQQMAQGEIAGKLALDYTRRVKAGKPAVDPLTTPRPIYIQRMRKLGLKVLPDGKVVSAPKGGAK